MSAHNKKIKNFPRNLGAGMGASAFQQLLDAIFPSHVLQSPFFGYHSIELLEERSMLLASSISVKLN